jgi:phage baseplate assembly protein W
MNIGSVNVDLKSRLPSSVKTSRWRGITTPFRVTEFGAFEPRGTLEVLWSSILAILLTPIGTRIMLPEFGSQLPDLVFEINNDLLQQQVRAYVVDAVQRWEPRVRVRDVKCYRSQYDDHLLHVEVTYEIISDGLITTNQFALSSSGSLYSGAKA